ncbi:MAG: hypothetical protein ACREK1_12205 [Longimicrobiales bacterium]
MSFSGARPVKLFTPPFISAAPAAGANGSYTTLSTMELRILSLLFTVTTSATVADRHVAIAFQSGGTEIFRINGGTFTASQTWRQVFAPGIESGSNANAFNAWRAIPDMWLPASAGIVTVVTGLQAGDQIGAFVIHAEGRPATV